MKTVKSYKLGQIIKHWCAGCIVSGEIIEINESRNDMLTVHDPVNWGGEIYTKTRICWDDTQNNFVPKIETI